MVPCQCRDAHEPRQIVLTGGPGGGKTAVLELIRQAFCDHVRVLQEAASVIFGGGFPRGEDVASRRAAQRAIFYVQRELEHLASGHRPAIVLCDRGTLDGLAYFPGSPDELLSSVGTSLEEQLARYHAVIHLRTPSADGGYNHQNPLRTESAAVAAEIDDRIYVAWQRHPRRFIIDSSADFLDKAERALRVVQGELPDCCKAHDVPALRGREVPAT